jgi:hypothetical protein
MKKGPVQDVRQRLLQEAPLSMEDGGTVEAISQDVFKIWEKGFKYRALGNLAYLADSLSYPGITFDTDQLDNLGKKLWCNSAGAACFPSAWPEKCTIPVVIRDTGKLPPKGKLRASAMEEVKPTEVRRGLEAGG